MRPDFCLAELQRAQWRHPAMRRLLVQGYVVLPVLSSTLTALILWSYGVSYESVARGVAVSVAGGMAYGYAASVAGGVVASVVGGVTAGVEAGVRSGEIRSLAEVVADGVALGLVLSVVAGVTRQQTIYSIARQIGGAIIGMGVGGVTFSILLVEWALRIGGATLIVSN